ncbi:TonB-dependent receptor domain-containing protein [Novosphingobium sp. JCM 18896]|uniref:TonB-dependent receptor domain-containing protein n=1 Tax=Novosphingobium sp. JCM 18896 TaxID=2989731 RepID=UPI002223E271|nr:TonB-dependent receptor [Novosphingobium sp. JCM 18896]MCW1429820.1 TonB-dependent receptor [Novosphingobium sp. JCM 18896]
MKIKYLLLAAACAAPLPAFAQDAKPADRETTEAQPAKQAFTTGVAKGRDMLDSAISASSFDGVEIQKLGMPSIAEILRNVPGIRAEAVSGEGNASYSIRGLPLAATGSKFMQFQEDGMPVVEFGDMNFFGSDVFMRADLSLAQVQTIRGGSASTFSSNSPGGVINFISKTGEEQGGAVQVSTGLDYDTKRIDLDYGGKLSDTLRFHVGGFYRQGEGPRELGYDALKGGQFKVNLTKTFAGGYVRLYGKYLDDRTPTYLQMPLLVGGTNADPTYSQIANFDIRKDVIGSNAISALPTLDGDNKLIRDDMREGSHPIVKTVGLDAQFELGGGWTINEKFRYSDVHGRVMQNFPLSVAPATALLAAYGGSLAKLSYASGPNKGQVIANPATLNGNGLMAYSLFMDVHLNSLDNVSNDLRASKVWKLGSGDLTTTFGYYHSSQKIDADWLFNSAVTDVVGGGKSSLLDITDALGRKQTQDGYYAYSAQIVTTGYRRSYDLNYTVDAPYASFNYKTGKLAVGGSVRYDFGRVKGTLYGSELGGGRVGTTSFDINGDGVISIPETRVGTLPLTQPGPVNYKYDYVSYSLSANYRFAPEFSAFARYSRGGRAAAERLQFTPAMNYLTGEPVDPASKYDPVKQAEAGVKFRKNDLELYLTGFWAKTGERNSQINSNAQGQVQVQNIVRSYKAVGAEFEGSYAWGPFKLTAGATYTDAEISSDLTDPTVIGNVPRHQANFIFALTPQYDTELFSLGANIIGTTGSFAQDTNQLKMPGYTTVNAFLQVRPTERIQLSLNANNVFNVLGLAEVTQAAIPTTGVVTARAINGRTISASARYSF